MALFGSLANKPVQSDNLRDVCLFDVAAIHPITSQPPHKLRVIGTLDILIDLRLVERCN